MSSELVKKLEAEYEKIDADVEDERHPNWQSEHKKGFLMGLDYALNIAEKHEAQQMKESFYRDRMLGYIDEKIEFMTAPKSPMGEYDKGALDQLVMMKNWLTKWAIEQEKSEEEK